MKTELAPFNITREAPLQCQAFDFVNEHCLAECLPRTDELLWWTQRYNDAFDGRTYGNAELNVCHSILLSLEIKTVQRLFVCVVHEMAHAVTFVRGIDGRGHGKEFAVVVTEIVKTLKKRIADLSKMLGVDLVVDRIDIQRTRRKMKVT